LITVPFHNPQSHIVRARRLLACALAVLGGLCAFPVRADEAAPGGEPEDWALHGQATFVDQYHPAFRAPYSGANSLDHGSRGNETFDTTLFAGLRVWDGGEAYIDPEIDQGFGLSNTLGIAAFPSGEAYKVGKASPYFRLQRLFFRQSFDLGGDAAPVAPAANQLGGSQTADNLVFTLGKFSVTDIFDTNSYAHDPKHDFLNWAIIDQGAFDYAADSWGYSYGGAAEWTRDWWTLRAGLFDLSRVPNGTALVRGFGQYQILSEGEGRFKLFGHDGKLRLLGWGNRARMGAYTNAVALAAATGTVADTASVRLPHWRTGASLNLEQGLTDDLGLFLRAGFANGSEESYEFTDMDRSVSSGLFLKGESWGRKDDTIGLAFEDGAISNAAQRYFAAGGLGTLIGDGRLTHYAEEAVLETYYSAALWDGITGGVDYQFIANPAYNADRGPVSVFGVRLHGEF
jgi:high affinity Mn2+ porin